MKQTKVLSCFPACGKTYVYDHQKELGITIMDSDSSKFSWIITQERRIGGKISKERNPEFPMNYINHIKENIGKVDYILVSSHKEVRDALIENDICFDLVFPEISCHDEWVGRCFRRGNDVEFCKLIDVNYINWVNEIKSFIYDNAHHSIRAYTLGHNQYLYDIIKNENKEA